MTQALQNSALLQLLFLHLDHCCSLVGTGIDFLTVLQISLCSVH